MGIGLELYRSTIGVFALIVSTTSRSRFHRGVFDSRPRKHSVLLLVVYLFLIVRAEACLVMGTSSAIRVLPHVLLLVHRLPSRYRQFQIQIQIFNARMLELVHRLDNAGSVMTPACRRP